MCGIIGISWSDKELVRKLLKHIRNRGPDGKGIYSDKNITLGHTRLSIIDLTKASNQPFTDDEGNVLVYNGEIYNYLELREELQEKGVKFRTEGDTEVLFEALKNWGLKALNKLNGMFAFAFYNKKQLIIARDRIGIKPLYYSTTKGLVFSSEINPLIELQKINNVIKLNTNSISTYFWLRHTLEESIVQGIKKLMPGQAIIYDIKTKNIKIKNWYFLPIPTQVNISTHTVHDLLVDAVQKRLIADVPIGFFLSGGLDSGIITHIASELTKGEDRIKTFSVGFAEGGEHKKAREHAEKLGSEHKELILDDNCIKYFDEIISRTEPVGQAAFIPTYLISKQAKKKVSVVQAGEGADEVFGGYDRYVFLKYGKYLTKISKLLPKTPITNLLSQIKGKKEYEQYLIATQLFEKQITSKKPTDKLKKWYKGHSQLQRIARTDIRGLLLHDFLIKADAMPMSFGLEERVPYLDHRIVKLGLRMKDSQKIRGLTTKYTLRKSFPKLDAAVKKRKKRGYNVPIDKWFSKGYKFREELELLMDETRHKYYDIKYAKKLLEKYNITNNYKQNYFQAQKLYSILVFEKWLRRIDL